MVLLKSAIENWQLYDPASQLIGIDFNSIAMAFVSFGHISDSLYTWKIFQAMHFDELNPISIVTINFAGQNQKI